jgi:hypothetical protein
MANHFEPTEDDMYKARIVLSDALPYELVMLDMAARYTQSPLLFIGTFESAVPGTNWFARVATAPLPIATVLETVSGLPWPPQFRGGE